MSIVIVREPPSLDIATRIASLGFVQPESAALRADVNDHLSHGKMLYSIVDTQKHRTVGFAIFNDLGNTVLYLSGIILDPAYQGRGIAEMAVQRARNDVRPFSSAFLALRTQSSRMWLAGRDMTASWYPNPQHIIDPYYRMLAERSATLTGSCFPVKIGCYGGPLYGEKPVHRDAELQSWWDSICDFDRGDAVFCFGPFRLVWQP